MDSNLPLISTYSVQKKPSLQDRFKDARPIVLFLCGCFMIGLSFPIFMFFLPPWLLIPGSFLPLQVLIWFGIGTFFGLAVVLIVRSLSRGILGGDKRKVEELEKRLLAHREPLDAIADLHALVDANLRMKRPQVAEFYSRQLLSISEKLDSNEIPKIELMLSSSAWVSTPAYHKKINYWLIWLFESAGTLCLTGDHLEYESLRISFRIELKDIVDIGLANHPWWLKPVPMHFIRVTYRDHGELATFFLTPYRLQTDTVFDVNNHVKEWYAHLTRALEKAC